MATIDIEVTSIPRDLYVPAAGLSVGRLYTAQNTSDEVIDILLREAAPGPPDQAAGRPFSHHRTRSNVATVDRSNG